MGTGKLNAGGNPVMDQHPIQEGLEKINTPSHFMLEGFALSSCGYSFHLYCFENLFMIKLAICIFKPRLGGGL